MTDHIKTSAIPAAGYVYQTWQGVNLLCDWLDSPTRYSRVRFECDVEAIAPQGLDDIVAERADGRIDLWQVKFTPSPARYLLDWDWMLEKPGKAEGRSRSLLRKWFDAFDEIDPGRLGDVCLLTNRTPDLDMEACLGGGRKIDYQAAPVDVWPVIEDQLGGRANARRFFAAFEIRHSDRGFSDLEAHVSSRLRRRGSPEGAEALKSRAVRWSIEKDQPGPDGWITIELLQAILRIIPPEPLAETFAIPTGYKVPDKGFHRGFLTRILSAPPAPIVLTGPPGRGKSTYLSKVCEILDRIRVPLVRHHYYLSTTDRSLDRHTSFAVEDSLLSQIKRFHGDIDVPDRGLMAALSACAAHYGARGKPFVVFLDGLDHVWRNQGQDRRPLDEVFNQVVPSIDNLVLVVGTQPVNDDQLPTRLLVEAPRSSWLELPPMTEFAVLQYLRRCVDAASASQALTNDHHEHGLAEAAAVLRTRTNGHPLQVIYATEELIGIGRPLSRWSVDDLTGDLSQDVRAYYASLWLLISASQKDALRLVCEFPFFWPRTAFPEIASIAHTPAPNTAAIEHLLHASAAGLRPFHESLVIFVKQTDGYVRRMSELTPHVATWLESHAPASLRVIWLWAVRAKLGSPTDLISGMKRDWIIARLEEGYREENFVALLDHAEEEAIQRGQYADAYRLRHVKHRLVNSLTYQLQPTDAARLRSCTWAIAPEVSVVDEALASRHEMSTVDVAALGLAFVRRGDVPSALMCGQHALRQHRGENRFAKHTGGSEGLDRIIFLATAFAETGALETHSQAAISILKRNGLAVSAKFIASIAEAGDLRGLVNIAAALQQGSRKLLVSSTAIRVACLAQADLSAWAEFHELNSGALAACFAALSGKDLQVWNRPLDVNWLESDYYGRQAALSRLCYDWFFGAVRVALCATSQDFSMLDAPKFEKRPNVSTYLNHLAQVGVWIGQEWSQRHVVPFSALYERFADIRDDARPSFDHQDARTDVMRSLHAIATDVCLLNACLGYSPEVSAVDMEAALEQPWFSPHHFRQQYVSGGVKSLSDEAACRFIESQISEFDSQSSEETGVRMLACLDLCELALRHGLTQHAVALRRRTWELALGYGQRKDPALSEAMDALEHLRAFAPDEALRLLGEIAPQIHRVLEYTDGKGTRHVLSEADTLLAQMHREALVEKFREHVEQADWSRAEHSLEAYVRSADSTSPVAAALLRTGLHSGALDDLARTATKDSCVVSTLQQAERHLGAGFGIIGESRPASTPTEWEPFAGDIKTYPASELARLLDDLREHFGIRSDVLQEWYTHLESMGQGSALIEALEPRLLSDKCREHDLNSLLDLAFATKLRLNGVKAAFPYIVKAQWLNGGWSGPMHVEDSAITDARLRVVVQTYRTRCDEFFRKSAYSWLEPRKESRVIPGAVMVLFLGLQGRIGEAVHYAEAMVAGVQDDTRTLGLIAPRWGAMISSATSPLAK